MYRVLLCMYYSVIVVKLNGCLQSGVMKYIVVNGKYHSQFCTIDSYIRLSACKVRLLVMLLMLQ